MSEQCSSLGLGIVGECQIEFDLLRRYQLLERLATTHLHRVYRALDRRDGRLVVVKIARIGECQLDAHTDECCDLASEGAMLRRIQRYGIAGPRLVDQQHVRGRPYLVSTLIPGYTLEVLDQHGWISQLQLLRVMVQVAQTLAVLHRFGYVHHDLKPSNIILQPDGSPVLIDWATACRISNSRQVVRMLTPGFASLAQIRGEVRVENDLYALGRTVATLFPTREPALDTIIRRATGQHADRFHSAVQVVRALTRVYLLHRMLAILGKR